MLLAVFSRGGGPMEGGCGGDPALGSFGRFPATSILRRAGRVGGWVSTCVHMGWGERKRGFGVLGGLGLGSFVRAEWPGLVVLGSGFWLDWLMGFGLDLGFDSQGLGWAGLGWTVGTNRRGLGGGCLGSGVLATGRWLGCLLSWGLACASQVLV